MNREQAAAILGCGVRSAAPVVKAAFAEKVKAGHPDVRDDGEPLPAHSLGDYISARNVLLLDAPTDCPRCYGSGWVAVGFKQERCPRGC